MARVWYRDRFIPYENGVHVVCAVCEKSYWLPQSKASIYATCGGECAKRKRDLDTEYRKRSCKTCGKEMKPRSVQIRDGGGIYCSNKCQGVAQRGPGNPFYGRKRTEAQKQKWKESMDANGSWLFAEKNPRWSGGRAAARKRYITSGKSAEALRVYRRKNPDKCREFCLRRRGRLFGKLPQGSILGLVKSQKGMCAACNKNLKNGYHVDHIMPLALGGKHEIQNIQLLCPPCNLKKSSKHPIDFMQSMGKLL